VPSRSSTVQIRDQVCVKKLPYTILAMPTSATFDVNPNATSAPAPDPVTLILHWETLKPLFAPAHSPARLSCTLQTRASSRTSSSRSRPVLVPMQTPVRFHNQPPGPWPRQCPNLRIPHQRRPLSRLSHSLCLYPHNQHRPRHCHKRSG
jgi:hypothetical protein